MLLHLSELQLGFSGFSLYLLRPVCIGLSHAQSS